MKLFKKLLILSSGLSFILPTASASELFNIEAMSSYKRSEKKAKNFNSNSFINVHNSADVTSKTNPNPLEPNLNSIQKIIENP